MGAVISSLTLWKPSSKYGMSSAEFREHGRQLLDYIVDYSDNIRDRQPLPSVKPGFLKESVPAEAPEDPEPWHRVYEDIDRVIMKGMTHTRNPGYHGYVPISGSHASSLASILESSFNNTCTVWSTCPIGTELEMLVMDWMAKALGLPDHFLHGAEGGGVLQVSSSEATLLCLYAAKRKAINDYRLHHGKDVSEYDIIAKLVAYSSAEAHFALDRACSIASVRHRKVNTDANNSMTGLELQQVMEQDRQRGLLPVFVMVTFGTPSSCAFDRLAEIGPLCSSYGAWLHVDAAYAGAAFICPEFRHYLHGIESVDSISVNFYKWMLVSLGCSGLWLRNNKLLSGELYVQPQFMKDINHGPPNLMNWQIHTTKRFSALKLWFVIRIYGIRGLQHHIREQIALANFVARMLKADVRFSLTHNVSMGLVLFKLRNQPDSVNLKFVDEIQKDGRVYLISSADKGGVFIRLCISDEHTTIEDVKCTLNVLKEVADSVIAKKS